MLLQRLRAGRTGDPVKRLLLLRVFGKADKRERLLEVLANTWRRVGRIDLIAGTDLAMRTLSSLMLEAFLLRRVDDMFLKTNDEVDCRLESLQSGLEADVHYPVNSINCYANAWQHAVARLAPESDAVLMDLRGFTQENQGCAFELAFLVQRVALPRIVLLTDHTTDVQVLEDVVHAAWVNLPADSPNVHDPQPALIVLSFGSRSESAARALFLLLLRAAYLRTRGQVLKYEELASQETYSN
jgi:hypothetical protein